MQCFFPQYVVPELRTSLFILNAAYDAWQVTTSSDNPMQNLLKKKMCDKVYCGFKLADQEHFGSKFC